MKGWWGCDLDGTLAHYDGWIHELHIGEPIQPMVDRVKRWLAEGREVRIFTARVAKIDGRDIAKIIAVIESWCETHIGVKLPVTNEKDFGMVQLWDDRCVQVVPNKGTRVDGKL